MLTLDLSNNVFGDPLYVNNLPSGMEYLNLRGNKFMKDIHIGAVPKSLREFTLSGILIDTNGVLRNCADRSAKICEENQRRVLQSGSGRILVYLDGL